MVSASNDRSTTNAILTSQAKSKSNSTQTDVLTIQAVLPLKVFKAYDIRGEYKDLAVLDKGLNDSLESCHQYITSEGFISLGVALAKWIKKNNLIGDILITYDTRAYSSLLAEKLQKGISSELKFIGKSNANVLLLGELSTPMSLFSLMNASIDAKPVLVLIVTASHNPWADSGVKIYQKVENGFSKYKKKKICLPICSDELRKIFFLQEAKDIRLSEDDILSEQVKICDVLNHQYIAFLLDAYIKVKDILNNKLEWNAKAAGMKICWNANFGAASKILDAFLKVLNEEAFINERDSVSSMKHFSMNTQLSDVVSNMSNKEKLLKQQEILPDGPDPMHGDNIKCALNIDADIVFSFDGDGDRLHVIWNKQVISSQILACVLAVHLKLKKVVHDVHMSQKCLQYLHSHGIKTISSKVGHSYVQDAMRKHNADLGVEVSGHFFWKECFGADDALLTAVKSLLLLITLKEDELFLPNLQIYQSNVKRVKVTDLIVSMRKLKQVLGKLFGNKCKVNNTDGMKIFYDEGWILIRGSNTQQMLSIMIEAYQFVNMAVLEERLDIILRAIL